MEAGGFARDVHVVDAGPHPVVVVRHVPAKLGPEGKVAAQETEKLNVGRQADGEAHGVGGDYLFRAVDRLVVPVDLDQHDGLDIVGLAGGLLDGVGGVKLYALALQPCHQGPRRRLRRRTRPR